MQKISKEAKLSKTYTNHCVRATCITILDKNGFESRHIMGISKHRSESSLKLYSSRLSDEKRIEASDILKDVCNGNNKENSSSIAVQNDIQNDQELIDFLSPSQEDHLLAQSVPDHIMFDPTSLISSSSNIPHFMNDTTNNMGLYAPFQQSTMPFNLFNYGTVNIIYRK